MKKLSKWYAERLRSRSEMEFSARWAAVGGVESEWLRALAYIHALPSYYVFPSDRMELFLADATGDLRDVESISLLEAVTEQEASPEWCRLRAVSLFAKRADAMHFQGLAVRLWLSSREGELPALRARVQGLADAGVNVSLYVQGNACLSRGDLSQALLHYRQAALHESAELRALGRSALELIYHSVDQKMRQSIAAMRRDIPELQLKRTMADIFRKRLM